MDGSPRRPSSTVRLGGPGPAWPGTLAAAGDSAASWEGADMTLLLNRAELERLLDVRSVIDAVERGFADYSAGKVQMPVRTSVRVSDPPGLLLVMPCAIDRKSVV